MTDHCSPIPGHWLLATVHALAFALLVMVATGCSGINASKSISPLDFLLPGLIQNSPPPPVIPNETNPVPSLAQAGPVPL